MNSTKRHLIIIGANARITSFLLRGLAKEKIFKDIYLISSRKRSKDPEPKKSKLHFKFSEGKLNSVIKSIISKNKGEYSFLFCNIPSRDAFEQIKEHHYIKEYNKFYQLVGKKSWFEQVVFLGTTASVHPNVFGSTYNEYRIHELRDFFNIWLKSGFNATLCIVPPLETSTNPIAKLFFVEKREIWAGKIIKLFTREKKISFEYPYRFHTRLIVKILMYFNLNKLS